jgi:hypothetical protein
MSGPKKSEMLQNFGHAGSHLREALLEALEAQDEWWKNIEIDFDYERHNRWWSRLSSQRRARWLLGQLWNCTDIVPGMIRRDMREWFPDDPEPFTYGRLVRLLARNLKDAKATV